MTEEDLLKQWEPKVQSFLRGSSSYEDREDLAQELRVAIIKCARKFDPNRGVSFHTYLHRAMENTRGNFWNRTYPRNIPYLVPLEDAKEIIFSSVDDPMVFQEINFSTAEKNLISLILAGHTMRDIRKSGIDTKILKELVVSLRGKLKLEYSSKFQG